MAHQNLTVTTLKVKKPQLCAQKATASPWERGSTSALTRGILINRLNRCEGGAFNIARRGSPRSLLGGTILSARAGSPPNYSLVALRGLCVHHHNSAYSLSSAASSSGAQQAFFGGYVFLLRGPLRVCGCSPRYSSRVNPPGLETAAAGSTCLAPSECVVRAPVASPSLVVRSLPVATFLHACSVRALGAVYS